MEYSALKRRVKGAVIEVFDPEHRNFCEELIWNGRKPGLHPRFVVRAVCAEDVQHAVLFAAANGLKVSPRGGGHHFTGIALNGDVVIDVSGLDGLQIDAAAQIAHVGPGVTNTRLATALEGEGFAFPVGHCASVPVSGYLLGGGIGWNSGEWGVACFSVTSAEVVMPTGELLHVDEQNHPDVLWALRGAGPEFFGIVTRYTVQIKPAPSAIVTSLRIYMPGNARKVGAWAEKAMATAPANLEFTVKITAPPPEAGAPAGAFVLAAIGTVFEGSKDEAHRILETLFAEAPQGSVLAKDLLPMSFAALYELTSVATPKGKRYAVDALWSNGSFAEVLTGMVAHFAQRPSPDSFALAALRSPLAQEPGNGAFSRIGRIFTSVYTIWDAEKDDEENMSWMRCGAIALEPLSTGTYVGQSDLERGSRPVTAHSFSAALRLKGLQAKYDPEEIFHGRTKLERSRANAA